MVKVIYGALSRPYNLCEIRGSRILLHKFSMQEKKGVLGGCLRNPVRTPLGPLQRQSRTLSVQKWVVRP